MDPNQKPPTPVASPLVCEVCHTQNPPSFFFCPNCGHNLRPKPLSTSLPTQLGIYLLSFFLPPLGLWPAFKYLKQKTDAEKMVAWVAIVLTIVSTIIAIWFTVSAVNTAQKTINSQFQNSLY